MKITRILFRDAVAYPREGEGLPNKAWDCREGRKARMQDGYVTLSHATTEWEAYVPLSNVVYMCAVYEDHPHLPEAKKPAGGKKSGKPADPKRSPSS